MAGKWVPGRKNCFAGSRVQGYCMFLRFGPSVQCAVSFSRVRSSLSELWCSLLGPAAHINSLRMGPRARRAAAATSARGRLACARRGRSPLLPSLPLGSPPLSRRGVRTPRVNWPWRRCTRRWLVEGPPVPPTAPSPGSRQRARTALICRPPAIPAGPSFQPDCLQHAASFSAVCGRIAVSAHFCFLLPSSISAASFVPDGGCRVRSLILVCLCVPPLPPPPPPPP